MQVIEPKSSGNLPPFELLLPERQTVPIVFSSPHSGRYYPRSFVSSSKLDAHSIRQSEDFIVDKLFQSAVENGAPLLCANYARAFVDVNREAYELDPKMFSGKLPVFANINSLRVAGGLGTVARIVSERRDIYHDKLDVDEVLGRITNIYKPYHEALRELLANTYSGFGYGVLVDCHSMPSAKDYNRADQRPDFIIGDRYGTSAASEIVNISVQILRDMGYLVAVNKPYAGGYITQYYGRPKEGIHAMQIEVNRGLYMDESAMVINDGFDQLSVDLEEFVAQLVLVCGLELEGRFPLAAE